MFGVLFEFLIYIFCLREADLKPLLHTVAAFPVSARERGVCPKACRCIYFLHLTGGSLVQLRVWLQTEFTPPRRGRVEGVVWDWAALSTFLFFGPLIVTDAGSKVSYCVIASSFASWRNRLRAFLWPTRSFTSLIFSAHNDIRRGLRRVVFNHTKPD